MFARQVARKVVGYFQSLGQPQSEMDNLTPREHEVLTLPAKGCLYKEIAAGKPRSGFWAADPLAGKTNKQLLSTHQQPTPCESGEIDEAGKDHPQDAVAN